MFLFVFSRPNDVVVHRRADDANLEILRRRSELIVHLVLDFSEQIRCGVPWENHPLENDRLPSSPVMLTIRSRVNKPPNFVCPRLYRLPSILHIYHHGTAPNPERHTLLLRTTGQYVRVPRYFSSMGSDLS